MSERKEKAGVKYFRISYVDTHIWKYPMYFESFIVVERGDEKLARKFYGGPVFTFERLPEKMRIEDLIVLFLSIDTYAARAFADRNREKLDLSYLQRRMDEEKLFAHASRARMDDYGVKVVKSLRVPRRVLMDIIKRNPANLFEPSAIHFHAKRIGKELQELGIEYILIGGSAICFSEYPVTTKGLDFVVLKFEELSEILKKERIKIERISHSLDRTRTSAIHSRFDEIPVDFLNPENFSENPVAFFEYAKKYRTKKMDFGRVAKPELVWYMRIVIPEWITYIDKILRDIKFGHRPDKLFQKVLAIARRDGREDEISKKILRLKREILLL